MLFITITTVSITLATTNATARQYCLHCSIDLNGFIIAINIGFADLNSDLINLENFKIRLIDSKHHNNKLGCETVATMIAIKWNQDYVAIVVVAIIVFNVRKLKTIVKQKKLT